MAKAFYIKSKLIYVRAMKFPPLSRLVFVSLIAAANGVLGDGKSLEQSDAAARVDVEAMQKCMKTQQKLV